MKLESGWCMFGLCFLDPEEVSDCYVEDLMSMKNQNKKLDEFCDYLVDTYINEESGFPKNRVSRSCRFIQNG